MELSGLLLSRLLDPLAGIGIQAAIDPVTIDPVGLAELPAATAAAAASDTRLLVLLLALVLALPGTNVCLVHVDHQLLRGLAVHGHNWLTRVVDELELIHQCCQGSWFQGHYIQGLSIPHVAG